MDCLPKPARRVPGRLASSIGALALVAALAAPSSQAASDGYATAMAQEHADDRPSASPAASTSPQGAVYGQDVVYAKIAGREVRGYLARSAAGKELQPGIIVIHEWWGLNDNIRSMARQLAGEGYAALAVDLYGGESGRTPEAARALMQTALADPEQIHDNLRQARDYLVAEGAPRAGSIGWCFGGGVSLEAGLSLGEKLDAVVMYYGRPDVPIERLRTLRAPLLGLFGAEDRGIPVAGVRVLEANLAKLGKTAEIQIYPDAGHAFANPSGSRYQAEAATDAWKRTLAFFREHLQP